MTFTVWHIVGICAAVAIVVAVIASLRTRRQDIKKVAYMLDALEDGELNFRLSSARRTSRIPGRNSSACSRTRS